MYLLEGNIGAGKTTLLQFIKNHIPAFEVIEEPLTAWHTDTQGTTLLAEFYKNPQRWTFTMEIATLTTRISEYQIEQAKKKNLYKLWKDQCIQGIIALRKMDLSMGL